MIRRSGGGLEAADCLITPELAGATYLRFSKHKELIALGKRAAEAQLPVIRAALSERAALAEKSVAI
jgi:hypothetical protein